MSLVSTMANPSDIAEAGAKGTSPPSKVESSFRQSPIVPLAPLEFLQTQRRGSITDPSLHAAGSKGNTNSLYSPKDVLRPKSPFVFGEASQGSSQLRRLLRSPSLEDDRPSSASEKKKSSPNEVEGEEDRRGLPSKPGPFDYSMRRHSIAVGQESPARLVGIKRKQDGDAERNMDVDELDETVAPAPKRRGSAVDTSRIAALSLNDRRNSTDSRGGPFWTASEGRRSSSSSLFSGAGGLGRAYSGSESPSGGRPPPGMETFTWTSTMMQNHPPLTHDPQRPFDGAVAIMPTLSFPPDRAPEARRMSVAEDMPAPPTTGSRALRSRSRPPSRQDANDDSGSAPSPPGSSKLSKEAGATPYSRSPELRVSHKLAERKRRKEMKELFDELRDQLPADRGMKASKWEILSKAIEFVAQLKQDHQTMAREIDVLRHELDMARAGSGLPPFPPQGAAQHPGVVYPPAGVPYPLAPPPGPMQQPQQPPPHSRPPSSQSMYPPGQPMPPQNGNMNRAEGPPT